MPYFKLMRAINLYVAVDWQGDREIERPKRRGWWRRSPRGGRKTKERTARRAAVCEETVSKGGKLAAKEEAKLGKIRESVYRRGRKRVWRKEKRERNQRQKLRKWKGVRVSSSGGQ